MFRVDICALCRYGEEGFGAIAGGQTLIFRVTLLG
jgi:FKBP-type peptidyl-prolyl cis-trans isomerase